MEERETLKYKNNIDILNTKGIIYKNEILYWGIDARIIGIEEEKRKLKEERDELIKKEEELRKKEEKAKENEKNKKIFFDFLLPVLIFCLLIIFFIYEIKNELRWTKYFEKTF